MSADYLVAHGAPTLAGLKTGNLFPCAVASQRVLFQQLRHINRILVPRGLRLIPLRLEAARALLYLFRPAQLTQDLACPEASQLLRQAGYPAGDYRLALGELRRRLRSGGPFPHEIGLFLGYPPEDVRGFIAHQGKRCKCAGCWKVYGDETAARQRFSAYHACTQEYCRRRAEGFPLSRLAVAT